ITHSPKDRIPRLIRELTNLKTSLPPGIFVRHAINRVDLWKVLIIGSPHTPYAHGLFEFDVCFPGNYPRQPPIFYFIAGGRYRIGMNPNLHPDGKVCLSLLNTWPGPSWNPAHSTPLQILVSIQAMIFCEEPWFNEPGREDPQIAKNPRALPASQVYNAHVRAGTVQYCVL
ncbi:UBC-like protein, partial [Viridothelium virens]